MGNRVTVAVAILALLAAPGCVGKKMFRSSMEDVDGRVNSVESAVEANQRRIDDVKRETDQKIVAVEGQTRDAMQRSNDAIGKAAAAEKAAQGKLLWDVMLNDDKVKFEFGRAQLSPGAASELDDLVRDVKGHGKALYLEIEGHTDDVGADALNLKLGETRAMAVRNYLLEHGGLPLHSMNTISYGESKPVADNSTRDGRSQNRRVVIRVLE